MKFKVLSEEKNSFGEEDEAVVLLNGRKYERHVFPAKYQYGTPRIMWTDGDTGKRVKDEEVVRKLERGWKESHKHEEPQEGKGEQKQADIKTKKFKKLRHGGLRFPSTIDPSFWIEFGVWRSKKYPGNFSIRVKSKGSSFQTVSREAITALILELGSKLKEVDVDAIVEQFKAFPKIKIQRIPAPRKSNETAK